LDDCGVHYIEGGYPGSNPRDAAFFEPALALGLKHSKIVAFGSTRRANVAAVKDGNLEQLKRTGAPVACIVGKSWDMHVRDALRISQAANLEIIEDSVAHLKKSFDEVILDAEHFFDGWKANADYALACLRAAAAGGADSVCLCDTNGGSLGGDIRAAVAAARGAIDIPLGIHCHNDGEMAVANSLVGVEAGCIQVQGTVNGLGERCGNANLISVIPNLQLKMGYSVLRKKQLARLTELAHFVDELANREPWKQQPYVGQSAFAHKAGLHVSAVRKNATTYEHIDPEVVGNTGMIPMSNQAGQSNLRTRLADAGLAVEKGDPALGRILDRVKARETDGYSYDGAQASFELLAREELGQARRFFELDRYRVTVERRRNALGSIVSASEAVVAVTIDGEQILSVSESHDEEGNDRGPVNALSQALKRDLGKYQASIDDMHLVDFKVRITQGGTEAVTRVIIDCEDGKGRRWSTVGVSPNIVDASMEALLDAIRWKLIRDAG
ncbi:MAG: citramalate synthase, partial [bacterium]